jgi:hypothetical protein
VTGQFVLGVAEPPPGLSWPSRSIGATIILLLFCFLTAGECPWEVIREVLTNNTLRCSHPHIFSQAVEIWLRDRVWPAYRPRSGYAAAFDVTTLAPGAIQEAVLMRPGAATHAFDMEQRLVELEIPVNGRGDR